MVNEGEKMRKTRNKSIDVIRKRLPKKESKDKRNKSQCD